MPHNFDPNQNYYSFIDNNTEPLVFVHGVGLDHKMWDSQITSINDYSTITYDLLGHGKTPYNKEEVTLNDFSDQLDYLLKFLKIDKINLVGFSLGSLIALDFASKFQDKLKSLTVIGATYKRTAEQKSLVIERFEQAKLNKPISKQALKRLFTDKYLNDHPEIYDQFIKILTKGGKDHLNFLKAYKLFAHFEDKLINFNQIEAKTLVCTAKGDVGSIPAMSNQLGNEINNSKVVIFDQGKHMIGIECAEEVNKVFNNFIEGTK